MLNTRLCPLVGTECKEACAWWTGIGCAAASIAHDLHTIAEAQLPTSFGVQTEGCNPSKAAKE